MFLYLVVVNGNKYSHLGLRWEPFVNCNFSEVVYALIGGHKSSIS